MMEEAIVALMMVKDVVVIVDPKTAMLDYQFLHR